MGFSEDWWAKKLANPQTTPRDIPQAPPSQTPMTRFEPSAPAQDPASKAQSAKQNEACPDCGSANYFGFQNSKPRCYECGYPMEQSGSKYGSLTGARVVGNAGGARGNDPTNNYNPQQIIGRIDG